MKQTGWASAPPEERRFLLALFAGPIVAVLTGPALFQWALWAAQQSGDLLPMLAGLAIIAWLVAVVLWLRWVRILHAAAVSRSRGAMNGDSPRDVRTGLDAHDYDHLAASVELTLELIDAAERRRSFPGPGRAADGFDDANEADKHEAIKLERRRYKALRARLTTDEAHGVPVAREFLTAALGLFPTSLPDTETEELYEQWLEDERRGTYLDEQ